MINMKKNLVSFSFRILIARAVNIKDNLFTKQGNSSIKSVVSNQEWVIMARVLLLYLVYNIA